MRIAQVLLPGASQYERKSQRIDQALLSERHEVVLVSLEEVRASGAQVAHVYATGDLPRTAFIGFPIPCVSSATLKKSRWSFRNPVEPVPAVLPEAVEDSYFGLLGSSVPGLLGPTQQPSNRATEQPKIVASFARPSTRNMVDQTLHRIHRFRNDVTWRIFDRVPAPEDLAGVDVWADPATSETDLDGFVAEALVVGLPVVAARTAVNTARLEKGRTGWLIPPGDPNEMTHAILSALFKPEVASNKNLAARQTASKFRGRHRLRVLLALYESLIR
jgi:Glycosyl transferases group 1